MAYTINHYNGSSLTTIADGTIDNTTDLKLIGKNYAGYGEVQNENLVFLLENFASTNEPAKPVSGQVWYDSGRKRLKFYDGTKFRTAGGAETGDNQPSSPVTGDFWFDTANDQLYAWNGTSFILVGPQGVVGSGTTQMISRSIQDSNGEPRPVIEAVIDDQTVFIISKSEFTIKESEQTAQYSHIKNGLTLAYSASGVTSTDYRFYGTASNSDMLGGVAASNFVRSDLAVSDFSQLVHFGDLGYTVGGSNNASSTLKVFIQGGTTPIVQNQQTDTIEFKTTVGGTPKTPMVLKGLDILPGADGTSNVGSNAFKFNNIYSNTFTGTATQANSINVDGYFRTASVAASGNTVPVRDSAGNLYANLFEGVATSAQFADLAEKYLADADYEVGTVVMVGGEKEVTACKWGKRAIGVVSGNPAFKMNSELEGGTYIALKGRVPVKVIGAVKKGDELIASDNGFAVVGVPHSSGVFAVALESNSDTGEKIIEALVL